MKTKVEPVKSIVVAPVPPKPDRVLSRMLADHLYDLLTQITHPAIYAAALNDKARLWEEVVSNNARYAHEIKRLMSDAHLISPPSPNYPGPRMDDAPRNPLEADINRLRRRNCEIEIGKEPQP